jgi:hypothetical protein
VAGGCLAVVTSVLLYEVAIPGLVVAVAVLVVRARRVRSARLPAAAAASATIGSLVYKAVASATLVGSSTYRVGYSDGALHHLGYLISGSIKVNFGTYGMGCRTSSDGSSRTISRGWRSFRPCLSASSSTRISFAETRPS